MVPQTWSLIQATHPWLGGFVIAPEHILNYSLLYHRHDYLQNDGKQDTKLPDDDRGPIFKVLLTVESRDFARKVSQARKWQNASEGNTLRACYPLVEFLGTSSDSLLTASHPFDWCL